MFADIQGKSITKQYSKFYQKQHPLIFIPFEGILRKFYQMLTEFQNCLVYKWTFAYPEKIPSYRTRTSYLLERIFVLEKWSIWFECMKVSQD